MRTLHRMGLVRTGERTKYESAEAEKNAFSEPRFRSYLFNEALKDGSVLLDDDFIDSAAEVCCCMQQTIHRYLKKVCSPQGWYESFEDESGLRFIRLKPDIAKQFGITHKSDSVLIDEGDLK